MTTVVDWMIVTAAALIVGEVAVVAARAMLARHIRSRRNSCR